MRLDCHIDYGNFSYCNICIIKSQFYCKDKEEIKMSKKKNHNKEAIWKEKLDREKAFKEKHRLENWYKQPNMLEAWREYIKKSSIRGFAKEIEMDDKAQMYLYGAEETEDADLAKSYRDKAKELRHKLIDKLIDGYE